MKKSILLVLLTMALASCHFETSDNGDLDGFWQLYCIDTLATGHSGDMRQNGIYWGVQMHLLSIEDKQHNIRYLFRFSHEGDTLRLYDPRVDYRTGYGQRIDTAIVDAQYLNYLGLYSLDEALHVDELNGSRLTLHNDFLRFRLRRY